MSGLVLLGLTILGGLGLFLALPGGRTQIARLGLVCLAGAAGVLAYVLLQLVQGAVGQEVWFVALSLVGLWGGVGVIVHAKPVYSALNFILVVIATTGLLLMAQAEFLAAALLIIYAGAILVTYVFVIMLAQQPGGPAPYDRRARTPLLGCAAGFVLLGMLSAQFFTGEVPAGVLAAESQRTGTVGLVGMHLLTSYVVGTQIAGVLLLAALVGAVAIARRRPFGAEEGEA